MIKRKGVQTSPVCSSGLHNAILYCHSEVWTRFPVQPAVQRQTLASGVRRRNCLVFVSDRDHGLFPRHFSEMIRTFKQQTKKPTGNILQSIEVSSLSFDSFFERLESMEISRFNAGEWLVELLCLIPIQIAVAQANRFIPLKDGVSSMEFERSLLGAEVGQIANSLSFGWYESLFRTYYSQKVTGSSNIHSRADIFYSRLSKWSLRWVWLHLHWQPGDADYLVRRTICGEKLCLESSGRHILCWECHEDNR